VKDLRNLPLYTPFRCLDCEHKHRRLVREDGEASRLYVHPGCMERYTATKNGRVFYIELWTCKTVRWWPVRPKRAKKGGGR
jgi:hypothetical protein